MSNILRPAGLVLAALLLAPLAAAGPASDAVAAADAQLCTSPQDLRCRTLHGDPGTGTMTPCSDVPFPPNQNLVAYDLWVLMNGGRLGSAFGMAPIDTPGIDPLSGGRACADQMSGVAASAAEVDALLA